MRRLADAPPVRRFLERPSVERHVALLKRSGVVRGAGDRARFVIRELLSRRVVARYRLRDFPESVLVRHGTPDVVTLDEVFLARDYEPPPAVIEALRQAGRPI